MRSTCLFLILLLAGSGRTEQVVLDETCAWRQVYRFAPSRISAAALRREGERVIGRRDFQKFQRDTEQRMRAAGLNPAQVDWREHADMSRRGARAFNPVPAPPPRGDWATLNFDDSTWVRDRHPFQGGPRPELTDLIFGQYEETVDLQLQAAYYRARFDVEEPKRAGLTLEVVYNGGVRVLVNGQEVARGHLPEGDLAPDAPGEDYPAEAYGADGDTLCQRRIRPVAIPAGLLHEGTNVLAIEVRASEFHPIVLTRKIQPNWGGPMRPWPHARLISVEVRSSGGGVTSCLERPQGVQVWVEGRHRRVLSSDFLPPGEERGPIRLVGGRNGTYGAQLVVASDRELRGLRVGPGDLAQKDGPGRIAGSAMRVQHGVPFPIREWTLQRLGDERGLGGRFPDAQELDRHARMADGKGPYLFDWLTDRAPAAITAGTARPIQLSLSIPADAPAGQYTGTVVVAVDGVAPAIVPVELEVVDWRLPDPKDFVTFVGCEQNPYGVARQYGVTPWSDEHFRLLAKSMQQLGRVGNAWLNVPVLARTEFGNGRDSMIRWARKPDGSLAFDYAILDRYLDLALEHWGRLRMVQFVVMQGMRSRTDPPEPAQVTVMQDGELRLVPVNPAMWRVFATELHAHMKTRGLAKAMYWGAPLEQEADPQLKVLLAQCVPGVYWTAGGHEIMANAKYCRDTRFYRVITDIRWQGGWPQFRDDMGWKSPLVHLANPRVGGTSLALHTTSMPYAYRTMVERALAQGRTGFTRVGADEWAGVHYDGMTVPRWLTGIPVLFVLWPGREGAEPSVRFEALLEGVQETEARIFLEQAVERGGLPGDLARRVQALLRARLDATSFFLGNSVIHSMEAYDQGWQERSRALYRAAAEVARHARKPAE